MGTPGQRPLGGGGWCPDKEMTKIPRAVALERKMKNENKKEWMGEGWWYPWIIISLSWVHVFPPPSPWTPEKQMSCSWKQLQHRSTGMLLLLRLRPLLTASKSCSSLCCGEGVRKHNADSRVPGSVQSPNHNAAPKETEKLVSCLQVIWATLYNDSHLSAF